MVSLSAASCASDRNMAWNASLALLIAAFLLAFAMVKASEPKNPNFSQAPMKKVDDAIYNNKVVIFSKTYCPYVPTHANDIHEQPLCCLNDF